MHQVELHFDALHGKNGQRENGSEVQAVKGTECSRRADMLWDAARGSQGQGPR